MDKIIEEIVNREWDFFDKVQNIGGRAPCQDDRRTFSVMRASQFAVWSNEACVSWLDDLKTALREGRNPLMEKYGYMMCISAPNENTEVAKALPPVSDEKKRLAQNIMTLLKPQNEEFARKYPHVARHARPLHSEDDVHGCTSMETYEKGELWSYSERTLLLLDLHIKELRAAGVNFAEKIIENSMILRGFESLEDVENFLEKQDR